MEYKEFSKKLNKCNSLQGRDAYFHLLERMYKNPETFSGNFRVTNIQTKIEQYLTQSQEVKFGNIFEEILTCYISEMGYENLNKVIGKAEDGKILKCDQLFTKDNVIYLIEQKNER